MNASKLGVLNRSKSDKIKNIKKGIHDVHAQLDKELPIYPYI